MHSAVSAPLKLNAWQPHGESTAETDRCIQIPAMRKLLTPPCGSFSRVGSYA